jgi:hypothetical protein
MSKENGLCLNDRTDGRTVMEVSFCVTSADCSACFNALNPGSLLGSVFKYEKTMAVVWY